MAVAAAGSMENQETGFIPTATDVITLAGTTAGYVDDDVSVSAPHERGFLRAGLVPIDSWVVARDFMVGFTVLEILQGHLQYAWDTDAAVTGVLTLDEDVGAPIALLVDTYAPNGAMGERVISMPKAISVGEGAYNIPKASAGDDNNQTLAMQFQGIGNTASNGLLGTLTDTYA